MARTLLASVALGCFVLTAGGCLVTSSSSVNEDGARISQETLRQIEPGVTTEAWLVAMLGEPDHRTMINEQDHTRVLRYDFTVNRSSGGTVFLLFAGSSKKSSTTRTFFEIVDGVVARHWTES